MIAAIMETVSIKFVFAMLDGLGTATIVYRRNGRKHSIFIWGFSF
jgi:hypothetical protein